MGEKIKLPKVDGHAVIEGVAMRGEKRYAIAMKKYNGNILLDDGDAVSATGKVKILKIFILRGIVNFFETLYFMAGALISSAGYKDEEERNVQDKVVASREEEKVINKREEKKKQQNWIVFGGIAFSLFLSVLIFFVVPTYTASLFFNNVDMEQRIWFNITKGIIRIVLFIVYLGFMSMMEDAKEILKYTGAAHKVLNCFEQGEEVTVENVKECSKFRIKSSVSIVFLTLVVCTVVFAFFKSENVIFSILERLVLVPLIIGISYEFTRLLGVIKGNVGRIIAMPWMFFQGFTVKEPEDLQIIVAITALNTVLNEENK